MKIFRWLGYGLAGIAGLVLLGATAAYVGSQSKLNRTYAVTVTAPRVPTDAAALRLGEHVATVRGCRVCHGEDLGGAKVVDDGAMGQLYGPNLTRGRGGLPEQWSDEDFVRAIRHGVGRNGRGLFLMPSFEYATLSEEDFGALLAYVKAAKPVDRARVPIALGPVARVLTAVGTITLSAAQIDHGAVKPSVAVPAISVDYGRYIAIGCVGCHGPNFSGGRIDVGPPDWPPAANLTPHPNGRLARWSEADFIRALRERRRPDGTGIDPVMPAVFGQMNETELKALWRYLQTVPAAATGAR